MKRVLLPFSFLLLITVSFLIPDALIASTKAEALLKHQNSNTGFIQNKGQIIDQNKRPNPGVLYLLNSPGFNVQLRKGGFSYDLYRTSNFDQRVLKSDRKSKIVNHPDSYRDSIFENNLGNKSNDSNSVISFHRIDINLLNANPNPIIETSEPSSGWMNYFTTGTPAGGVTFVRSFITVTYKDIYPGIDLQFIANNVRPFEYNFIIQPGADIASIKFKVSGPEKIKKISDGIRCETSIGEVDETIPLCYYMISNKKFPVRGKFKKIADHMYGFSVDQVVPSGSILFIDPVPTRRWGTYYGGTGTNLAGIHGLAIDGNGNSIIVGWTMSTNNIATAGAHQETLDGGEDGFIAKFLPDGTLLWGTYYGGSSVDEGYCCAVDKDNNIFFGGSTYSTDNIATPGAFQTTLQGQPDAVLAKFSPDGILLWGTYYGGASSTAFNGQSVTSCSADTSGNIYYAGITSSQANIATPGAVQPNFGGGLYDVFLICFAGDGTRNWGTYYGGTGVDQDQACSVSKAGLVYLSGATTSPNNIATSGSFMPSYTGGTKAFLACFNLDGTRRWGTYFGGDATSTDVSYGCAADTGSSVYLFGTTNSLTNIGTSGTFQPVISGMTNAYLEKFDSSCGRTWGTYFGPSAIWGAAVDDSGFVFLAGHSTVQSPLNFSPDGYQTFIRGGEEAMLAKFDGNGQRIWSTYYGGTGNERGLSCGIDPDNNIYLMGNTNSINNTIASPSFCTRNHNENYIATPGSHQTELLGISDPYLVKFSGCRSPDTALQINGPSSLCVNSTGIVYSIAPIATATDYTWCVSNGLSITAGQHTTSITIDVGGLTGFDTISVYGINSCDTGFPKVIIRRVYQRPVPMITGTDTTCTGLGTLYTTAIGKTNYQWTVSPGAAIVAGGTVTDHTCTVIWSNAGAQWIRLNYTDTTGCNAITPTQFNVWVILGPPVSVSITPSVNPACEGSPVTFTAIGINGGIAPTYQWKVNGIGAGSNNSAYTYVPVNGDVVTCVFTSNGVCASNNPASSNPVIMIINTNLVVGVSIAASANPVCAGTSVTFTATPSNGGNSPSYQWKVNGLNAGTNSFTYSYIPVNGDIVNCVLSSSEICTINNPASSNQVIMIINPNLAVGISISPSANPVCQGSFVMFTATPTNGGSSPSYQWKINGINSGSNSPSYSYIPGNGDIVTCVITSNAICPAGNPATSNAVSMIVNPILAAGISISTSSNPFCPGNSVTFIAVPVNGGLAPVYQWKVNGINAGTNSPIFSYNPLSGDMVSCILTSNLPCVTANPTTSNSIIMSGTLASLVTFKLCNDSITTTNAKPFKLKGGIPLGGTYSGAGVAGGIFNPGIAGAGNHQITYTYTNAALCSTSANITIITGAPTVMTCGNPITDIRDNKVYQTVQIGSQCWMAEDLNYGIEISANTHQRDNCIPEKYHNPASSIEHPASVYQWDEIMNYDETISTQGLCPPGWHVPTEADWNTLFANYINNGFAASPLKYSGFSGFNAVLSGARHMNKTWDWPGFATFFWSSTAHGPLKAWSHGMNDTDPSVSIYPSFRNNAFSVRCLKD